MNLTAPIYRLTRMLAASPLPPLEGEDGQTLAEYALILTLIAVVLVVVLGTLGGTIKGMFSHASSSI